MEALLDGVRRTEYTGTRRCWPCTIVNLVVLGLVTAFVAVASIPVALFLITFGCVVIWLRGYFVPYTPRFAPQLTEVLPWDPFHPTQRTGSLATPDDTDGVAVMQALDEAGVIRSKGEAIELTETFDSSWNDEMRALSSLNDEELMERVLQESPTAVDATIHRQGEKTYIVLTDGSDSAAGEAWLRRPVAIVETAAAKTLRNWATDPILRANGAHALGLFLTTCPECGSLVTERPATGCCGPPETGENGEPLQALVCESCDIHYHVLE